MKHQDKRPSEAAADAAVVALDHCKSRLRALMAERRIKPAPLARAAGLNESAVRDILRGRSQNPGLLTLTRIAGALKVTTAELTDPALSGSLGHLRETAPQMAEELSALAAAFAAADGEA